MIRIKVCSCCGSPYEIDDADTDLLVCGECNPEDEDLIGLVDMEDFDARD
jgi:hypothetical protein